jgi:HK97 family phage portal protein
MGKLLDAIFGNKRNRQNPQNVSLSAGSLFSESVETTSGAMRNSLVWACVKIISEAVATLPCQVYRINKAGERELANFFREYDLLQSQPNDLMTAFSFKQAIVAQLLLRGNAFLLKDKDAQKNTVGIIPIDPEKVEVSISASGIKLFKVEGAQYPMTSESIIHLVGLTLDGVVGLSVLEYNAETIGLNNTLKKFTKKYFKNSANPGGFISSENENSKEDIDRLKASWSAEYSSVENAGKTPLLPKGFKYNPLALNAKDAMLIEALGYGLQDIGRIFGVPSSRLGDLSKTSYASQEQDDISFLKYTILPWLKRIENALTVGLFGMQSGQTWVEFNADAFLRSTTIDRYQAHNIALQAGWATRNEIRKKENLKPLPGLDQIYIPLNQGTPAQAGAVAPKAKRKQADEAQMVLSQDLE